VRYVRGAVKDSYEPLRDRLYLLSHFWKKYATVESVLLNLRHPAISPRMFYVLSRSYERGEAELVSRHFSPRNAVLEAGGGVGFLSLHCLKNIGVRQYAIVEANRALTDLIEANFAINHVDVQSVAIFTGAVADCDGELEFTNHKDFWSSSLVQGRGGQQISVKAYSIPTLISELDFTPNTLIMDIEGAELLIPIEHFTLFDTLLIETHPGFVGKEKIRQFEVRLGEAGFIELDRAGKVVLFRRST
jgi:FkbM family methyltransferase